MNRIIFVHLLNDFSGSPKVLSQVIKATELEYKVELFTGKSQEGFLTGSTVNHHQYYYKWYSNKYLTLASFLLSQGSLFFKIIQRRKSFNKIYINTMLPFGAALAGKFCGKEVIYHVHETSIKPELFKKFLRGVIQRTASKIIFVSEALRTDENFHKKEEWIIYNALEKDFINQSINLNNGRPVLKESFNVLMICSLKAYKGVEEFIDIAKLCEDSNIEFSLVLNSEEDEVESYFSSFQLPNNMEIFSKQSNVHRFYENADIVLNLSRPDQWVETFGLTIIEAMAHGLPVIVPPVGGPAEIVSDGVEGYLISSYETLKIAEKVIELSKDKEQYRKLSQKGIERAAAFDEETFQRHILAVINEK